MTDVTEQDRDPMESGPTAAAGDGIGRAQMMRFVCGRGAASLADQFLLFAVPLLVYRMTGSASKSGLIFLIEWLPRVLFLPLAGVVADRVGGYIMYVTADVARATLTLVAFVSIQLWTPGTFLILAVMVATMALASAQAYVAMESTLPRFVPMDQMVRAQSIIQGTEQAGEVIGPALAALLSVFMPTSALILMTSGLFACTALNVFLLRAPLRTERREAPVPSTFGSILTGVGQGVDVLRRLPALLGLVGLTMTVNFMVGVGMSTSAAITTGTLHKPDRYFGLLSSAAGIVGLLSFFVIPRLARRIEPVTAIVGSYGLICLGALGISQASNFIELAVGYALLIGTIGMFNVFIRAERIRRIPGEHLGKTIGLIIVLHQVTLPLAGLVVATFARAHGPQMVVLGSVVTSAIVALFLLPLVVKLRAPALVPIDRGPSLRLPTPVPDPR